MEDNHDYLEFQQTNAARCDEKPWKMAALWRYQNTNALKLNMTACELCSPNFSLNCTPAIYVRNSFAVISFTFRLISKSESICPHLDDPNNALREFV